VNLKPARTRGNYTAFVGSNKKALNSTIRAIPLRIVKRFCLLFSYWHTVQGTLMGRRGIAITIFFFSSLDWSGFSHASAWMVRCDTIRTPAE
jgi:hypothetical protein